MKKTLLLLLLMLGLGAAYAQRATVSGKVTDAQTKEAVIGANVYLEGTTSGTVTDEDGMYSFTAAPGDYTLIISYVGYGNQSQKISLMAGKDITVDVMLETTNLVGQEVVVSASRSAEKITNAPATISVINARSIAELPSFNVAELLGRQRGLDYVRSGVLGIGVNARGFNSAFNPKNLQVNDGRFSTLIATGLPLGALSTTVKEDVERIEVVLGPSSALYGPNAHNGLINTITKNPRTSQGTTVAMGFTSSLQDGLFGETPHAMSYRLRHAMKLGEKLSFKVSGEYTQGQEFNFIDSVYIGVVGFNELGSDFDNEGLQQPDFGFNSLRGEAQVYYAVTPKSDIIASYGGSKSNNIGNTNAGRNQIKDWLVNWAQLRYVSPRFFAQVYNTWSSTDSTFAMNQRTVNYWTFRNNGFSAEDARVKSFTKQWFPIAGFPGGGLELNRGSIFQDRSQRFNAEAQYNNRLGNVLSYIVGVQYQRDAANSNGTYLLDKNADGEIEDIVIGQLGGYLQADLKFGTNFKAVLAARADQHDLYGFNFIPKAALVYYNDKGSFRLTFGQGIAAPTILNLEANIFGGVLLGNGAGFTLSDGSKINPLKVETISTLEAGYKGQLSNKLFVDANAYYNWSKDFLSPALNIATNGRTVTHRGDVPMSQVVPGTPATGSTLVLTYLNFGDVNTYGFDASVSYSLSSSLLATLNYSYFGYAIDTTDLANDGNRNGKVDENDLPINTPTHKLGLGLNYTSGKFFGSLFGRWVDQYDFFSGINVAAATNTSLIYSGSPVVENARVGRSFNNGPLGGFFNLDLSAGYRISDIFTVSGQVTNLLNAEVREFVASPAIAPLYSLELKVNLPAIGK
ncbi:MAG TPA: TonB-dependent receptor [Saprospiraceae bacterium]|nr:TonB-dependent receptor [Saprospiraceae bacterium]